MNASELKIGDIFVCLDEQLEDRRGSVLIVAALPGMKLCPYDFIEAREWKGTICTIRISINAEVLKLQLKR